MIRIREATRRDLENVLDLWQEFTHQLQELEPDYFRLRSDAREIYRKQLKQKIQLPHVLVLVLEDAGRLVGYHIASIRYPGDVFVQKPYGHISDLYLQAEYRGQNFGRQLIEHTMGWLVQRGIRNVNVKTFATNEGGIQFWEENGFAGYELAFKAKI